MTPTQWHQIVDEVNSLWGSSPKWSKAKKAVWKYAQNVDYQGALETVERVFLSDKTHPPSPSEVISQTRTAGGVVDTGLPCTHPVYAVTEWHADGTGKAGLCASCHTEFRWEPLKIRTPADWEARTIDVPI